MGVAQLDQSDRPKLLHREERVCVAIHKAILADIVVGIVWRGIAHNRRSEQIVHSVVFEESLEKCLGIHSSVLTEDRAVPAGRRELAGPLSPSSLPFSLLCDRLGLVNRHALELVHLREPREGDHCKRLMATGDLGVRPDKFGHCLLEQRRPHLVAVWDGKQWLQFFGWEWR